MRERLTVRDVAIFMDGITPAYAGKTYRVSEKIEQH